jgi:hypothetical protein
MSKLSTLGLCLLFLVGTPVSGFCLPAFGADPVAVLGREQGPREQGLPAVADQGVSLRETLEKGLRARLPEEFEYIDRVVTLVDQGVLPLSLVLSTFKWARKQHQVYPFVYFKLGLRERAGKLGIPL